MKKFKLQLKGMIGAGLLLVAFCVAPRASDYTVTLSTYNPRGSASEYTAGAYPNISGAVEMRSLIIANNGPMETVTVYDTCTSSTAATVAMTVVIPSSSTWPQSGGNQFPARLFNLTSPCIKKSSTSTTVTATFIYE